MPRQTLLIEGEMPPPTKESPMSQHTVSWFEIPAADLARAARFYGAVIDQPLSNMPGADGMALFPYAPGSISGAVVTAKHTKPSADGPLVYLNATGKLDAYLARVPAAGGKVLVPRTSIGEHGFFALIRDTEGNTVGL